MNCVNTLIIEKTDERIIRRYFFTQLNLFSNNVFEVNIGILYLPTCSKFGFHKLEFF